MTAEPAKGKGSVKRKWIAGVAVGAIVLGGGAAVALWAPWDRPAAPAEVAPSPSPSAVPPPEPVAVPLTNVARAGVPGWQLASRGALAAVLPEVGDPATGAVALRVDAPVVTEETVAVRAAVRLQEGERYTISAAYRQLVELPRPTPAVLQVGAEEIPLDDAAATWSTVTHSFVAQTAEDEVRLVLTGPITGLSIDAVSVTAEDGTDVVPNGSFEDVEVPSGIVNDSLVMTADSAVLAVAAPAGSVSWRARSTADGEIVEGVAEVAGGLDAISLADVPAGHHEIELTGASNLAVRTAIAIVDTGAQVMPQDARFGVGLHVERDWYRHAGTYAAALGFAEARNDILWDRNERERGVYSWNESYAREFDILHSNGVKLLGIVNYNNKLYGQGKAPASEQELAAYGRYAAAIADRFDLVGLEVFNEFNHDRFNDTPCGTNGACYLPLLRSVHDQVAADHPDLPIVAGSTALYDHEFFVELWQAGALPLSDAMSFHPYEVVGDNNPDALRGIVDRARRGMAEHAGGEVPVWITELGWTTRSGATPLAHQGTMLVRAEVAALATGTEKFFWYDLINDSADGTEHEGNFGLYEHGPRPGTVALAPKPAAFAQALLISMLAGREFVASEGGGAAAVEVFGAGEDAVRVAWAPTGAGEAMIASEVPLAIVAVSGEETVLDPEGGVVSIPLTADPVFIRSTGGAR